MNILQAPFPITLETLLIVVLIALVLGIIIGVKLTSPAWIR